MQNISKDILWQIRNSDMIQPRIWFVFTHTSSVASLKDTGLRFEIVTQPNIWTWHNPVLICLQVVCLKRDFLWWSATHRSSVEIIVRRECNFTELIYWKFPHNNLLSCLFLRQLRRMQILVISSNRFEILTLYKPSDLVIERRVAENTLEFEYCGITYNDR